MHIRAGPLHGSNKIAVLSLADWISESEQQRTYSSAAGVGNGFMSMIRIGGYMGIDKLESCGLATE